MWSLSVLCTLNPCVMIRFHTNGSALTQRWMDISRFIYFMLASDDRTNTHENFRNRLLKSMIRFLVQIVIVFRRDRIVLAFFVLLINHAKTPRRAMAIQYFVCLDFEATCWQERSARAYAEIIGERQNYNLISVQFHRKCCSFPHRISGRFVECFHRSYRVRVPPVRSTDQSSTIEFVLHWFNWHHSTANW